MPAPAIVCARRAGGEVKAVVASFSTHPNSVAGESHYSADVPGAVRRVLRAALGEGPGVVYLTGAAGDTALATCPGELCCRFGLDIKAASPAPETLLAQLTDGSAGYIPTPEAIRRGGYRAYPGRQCQLAAAAGAQVATACGQLLAELLAD